MEYIPFVILGLWTALVIVGVGVAVMLRFDAIEKRLDSLNRDD